MWKFGPKSDEFVIKDQLQNNIIEEVTDAEINNSSNEFYMRHRAVICESTESAKLRVVYEASVKSESGFLLNDCLEKWSEKANYDIIKIYRFTRLVFGLNQSQFYIRGHCENTAGCSVN